MNNSIRVIHISDIHLNPTSEYDFSHYVLSPLLADLKKYNETKKIDIIALTGDLIDQGGKNFESIDEGFTYFKNFFLSPILKELKLLPKNVFFTIGNHDIDRDRDSELVELGAKSSLTNEKKVSKFIDDNNSESNEAIKRVTPFKNFENYFYQNSDIDKNISVFESTYKLKKGNLSIGIACINSSWRCYSDEDKGYLLIGERQITRSLDFINECDIKIFMSHHYTDFLCDFERIIIDDLVTENFNIALLGHNHSPEAWYKSINRGAVFNVISRGNWTNNIRNKNIDYLNGYSIIDYNVSEKRINIYPRVYSKKRNEYVIDSHITGDEGKISHFLQDKESDVCQLHSIVKHINDNFISSINENLLTYNTDTDAPNDINKIFVEPNLIYRIEKTENDIDEQDINIDEICSSENNYIVFGPKESGKTILLDKILIRFLELINEKNYIPVLIDFNTFQHSRIETSISHFTGIKIREIDSFITSHKLVLIIDNLNLNSFTNQKLKKFLTFFQQYPSVRLICSSLQLLDGQIPIEFLESVLFDKFEILFLKYFKSKQIIRLTEQWFSDIDIKDKEDKIENIINLLMALELPRTPLAISMFLWIIEKQEDYHPINQATMLENFIEKLFKKHSKDQLYYGEFDYKNKESLLSSIANEMYENENDNYSLLYSRLLDYTVDHLNKRHFDHDAEEILKHFIDVGLFIKENSANGPIIRFRFNCFFQYFLMKNMDSEKFFNYVMEEKNYLSFYDEIDYYTGIKRNRSDILKILLERMNNLFKELKKDIENIDGGVDSFFLSDISLADKVDHGFIESIKEEKNNIKNQIEDIKDQILDSIKPKEEVETKKFNISPFRKLERSWTLSAKVLRNTEETDEPDLKYNSFKDILYNSLLYLSLYKLLFNENLNEKKDGLDENKKKEYIVMLKILPILHESLLNEVLSSSKLTLLFQKHLDIILDKKNILEIEKLMTVFLYTDSKGKNSNKYIKDLLSTIKNKNLYDMILLKVLMYFFIRSDSKEKDNEYLNLIADIIIKSHGNKKINKTEIIKKYRKKKKKIIDENQLEFKFSK